MSRIKIKGIFKKLFSKEKFKQNPILLKPLLLILLAPLIFFIAKLSSQGKLGFKHVKIIFIVIFILILFVGFYFIGLKKK